ncbi:MAG TPA: [protein-PII] uridylyltransferase [Chthoniobacteraceae bacterium]|jgi:[protein-PII] uridylyltransferase|nr:[protein-PII] uridylyltransferase [Chthoniobacteraceae bacterium]
MDAVSRHREKVLAHAEAQLALQGKESPAELLALYKRFLKIENHRLRLTHYAEGGGKEIAHQRASLVDIVLRHLFDGAAVKAGDVDLGDLSLVAIGGYGRDELNPFSDVDIMFLHSKAKEVPAGLNEVIQMILYMLWDIGFKVGHSTRSITGAIKQANIDMLSKTSLLESRHVAGSSALFEEFREEFVKRCVHGHEKEYILQREENQAERHTKFGGTVYMQEPNVKNGCGGLRDYQNLLWISFFREGLSSTAELVQKKLLPDVERRRLDRAYDFLLRVRTELHYLNKRGTDVLSLNFQGHIANNFNYPQKNILRRTEAFMRDYYQHARNIYNITETLSERMGQGMHDPKRSGLLTFFSTPRKTAEHFDGFFTEGDLIYAESREIFAQDPYRMMRLFQHAQQRHLRLSPELQQLIRRRLPLVGRTFQYSRAARETFQAILSRKGEVGRILRMMHRVDFLGRYVPEFGDLTCLVQHEFFHRYTADEHTLVCIEKLDSLIDTNNPKLKDYRILFQKLEDPYVLYLALLLHDTGKATGARYHAEASALYAQRVAARLQLNSERRKSLILLVDNHMTLSNVAQRRNLDDSTTIQEFAEVVRSQSNMDALMLLTLADGQGTGDENWSDWKESLVWQLYRSTTQYLEDGASFFRQRRIEREGLRKQVGSILPKEFEEEVEAHFQYMPDYYFQTNPAQDIAAHIKLFRAFLERESRGMENALAPVVKWVAHPEQGHSEVWICTWDRQALLAKIAGSLSVAHLNILSADIFTRGDSLALDFFRVCDTKFQAVTDQRDVTAVEKMLKQALSQEDFDFRPLLQKAKRRPGFHLSQELDFPTRISIDNGAHPVYTLVDIQTPDRLGLLYYLLRAFSDTRVNIVLSRITTEKGAAIDSFYVADEDGRKIRDPERITEIQKALQQAAGAASPKEG